VAPNPRGTPWFPFRLSAEPIEDVDLTGFTVEAAPEHDPSGYRDQEYRLALAEYYAQFY